jgi:hypothetical protein
VGALQFIADVIKSMTGYWAAVIRAAMWPASILLLAMLFRAPLLQILPRLKVFEGLGLKASFDDGVDQLIVATEKASLVTQTPTESIAPDTSPAESGPATPPTAQETPPQPAVQSMKPKRTERDIARDVLNRDLDRGLNHRFFSGAMGGFEPLDLVIHGWSVIDGAVQEAARASGLGSVAGTPEMARALVSRGLLTIETYNLIQDALRLRNEAVHEGRRPSMNYAVLYAKTANSIALSVEREAGLR